MGKIHKYSYYYINDIYGEDRICGSPLTLLTRVSLIPALLVLVVVSLSLVGSCVGRGGRGFADAAADGGGRSRVEARAGRSFLLVSFLSDPNFFFFSFLFSVMQRRLLLSNIGS